MNRILTHIIIIIAFFSSVFSYAKKPEPIKITKINILEAGVFTMHEKGSKVYVNKSDEQNISKLEVKEVTNWKLEKKTDIVPRTQRVIRCRGLSRRI
jgi:hypothetical protein